KFKIRRTADAPSKSGVAGLLCSALGISRDAAHEHWLPTITELRMGVRIDRAGLRWWDFHTVGAGQYLRTSELAEPKGEHDVGDERATRTNTAELKDKAGPILSRREYLADASFLVALQGKPDVVNQLYQALVKPKWCLFLGRKSCPPSKPICESAPDYYKTIFDALMSIPICIEDSLEEPLSALDCLVDWIPEYDGEQIPQNVEVYYDVPVSFQPPYHKPRFVQRLVLPCPDEVSYRETRSWTPDTPKADYSNSKYKNVRAQRLIMDNELCVLCKSRATTVQHVDYSRAGGNETLEDLRSLCRLCHDACTMLEYGSGMTTHRIDPCLPEWRERILSKREEIVRFRSQETKRRMLDSNEEED
ncbi:MAG TPA: type I-E CRISPR-associated protein Cas5/CasD, partial [Candidatus Cloacimonadota bacterium]|nr:type I-E CRISPR-associated protein Cas5/CasD [Candidatus Cloacimonadota bacterium]